MTTMLKAALFTTIITLLSARLPALVALIGVAMVAALEIGHIAVQHQESWIHALADFGALNLLGQIGFVLANLLLIV